MSFLQEESSLLTGVGLLLFCRNRSHLLTLRELRPKPLVEKDAGMVTFPLETVQSGESVNDALKRLCREEIGIQHQQISSPERCGFFRHEFPEVAVQYFFFMAHVWRTIHCAPYDDDIVFHKWMHPDDLLEHLHTRIEVQLFLQRCLDNTRCLA